MSKYDEEFRRTARRIESIISDSIKHARKEDAEEARKSVEDRMNKRGQRDDLPEKE